MSYAMLTPGSVSQTTTQNLFGIQKTLAEATGSDPKRPVLGSSLRVQAHMFTLLNDSAL
jgi:hypothetical protein